MRCPYCGNENRPIPTVYTAHIKDGITRRGKHCTKCKQGFISIERGYPLLKVLDLQNAKIDQDNHPLIALPIQTLEGVVYEEKLLEGFIRDYPKEFLGEDLVFYQQQPIIGGFRPYLIFLDKNKKLVIVEIQLEALDRNHLYRAIEYRDLLMEQEGCQEPRVILFCNWIKEHHVKLLKTHRVSCIAIIKDEFLEKAHQLRPDLELLA